MFVGVSYSRFLTIHRYDIFETAQGKVEERPVHMKAVTTIRKQEAWRGEQDGNHLREPYAREVHGWTLLMTARAAAYRQCSWSDKNTSANITRLDKRIRSRGYGSSREIEPHGLHPDSVGK